MKQPNMADLIVAWQKAKAAEAAANVERLEVERLMIAQIPTPEGNEGSVSMVVGEHRVAVRYSNTVKVDTAKLQGMWESLPEAAHKAFRWKAEADIKNLRGLREFAPADYAKVVVCVETKPAKPSLSIATVEEKEAA